MEDQSTDNDIDEEQSQRNTSGEDEYQSNRKANQRNRPNIIKKPKRWSDYRSWPAIPGLPVARRAFLRVSFITFSSSGEMLIHECRKPCVRLGMCISSTVSHGETNLRRTSRVLDRRFDFQSYE